MRDEGQHLCTLCYASLGTFTPRTTCTLCKEIVCGSCKQVIDKKSFCKDCVNRFRIGSRLESSSSLSLSEAPLPDISQQLPIEIQPLQLPSIKGRLCLSLGQKTNFQNEIATLNNGELILSSIEQNIPIVRISLDEDWIICRGDETNKIAFTLSRSVRISDQKMPTWIAYAPTEQECIQWASVILDTRKKMGFDDDQLDLEPHFSGILEKKGNDIFGIWRKRRFAVYPKKNPNTIYYYRGDNSRSEIPLTANWDVCIETKTDFGFTLSPEDVNERKFSLRALNSNERETWIRVIRACIDNKKLQELNKKKDQEVDLEEKRRKRSSKKQFTNSARISNIDEINEITVNNNNNNNNNNVKFSEINGNQRVSIPKIRSRFSKDQFTVSGKIYEYRGYWLRRYYGLENSTLRCSTRPDLLKSSKEIIKLSHFCSLEEKQYEGKNFCLFIFLDSGDKLILGFQTRHELDLWKECLLIAFRQSINDDDTAFDEGIFNYNRKRFGQLLKDICKTPKQGVMVASIFQICLAIFILLFQVIGNLSSGTGVFSALLLIFLASHGLSGAKFLKGSSVRFYVYGNIWLGCMTFLFFVVHLRRMFQLGDDSLSALFFSFADIIILPTCWYASSQANLLMKIIRPEFEMFGHDKVVLLNSPLKFSNQNQNQNQNYLKFDEEQPIPSSSSSSRPNSYKKNQVQQQAEENNGIGDVWRLLRKSLES